MEGKSAKSAESAEQILGRNYIAEIDGRDRIYRKTKNGEIA
jgi:hypothetical protein